MDRLYSLIQVTTITLFLLGGMILYRVEITEKREMPPPIEAIRTTFVMEEPRPLAPPPPPTPVQRRAESTPVDLTKTPQQEIPQQQEPQQVRKVYGLHRVYSQGLGAGGETQDIIVGRLGNTLDTPFDTLTATAADLRGQPVAQPRVSTPSAAEITRRPNLKSAFRNRKPQYSRDMLLNRIEGIVRARLLIGADGAVRQVEIVSDIGYDSAEVAREFLMTLQFNPALRGNETVSVWIPFSIKFELI